MLDLDLGPCCCCERRGRSVRNMISLKRMCPIPGRGWGCVECHLPLNGAVAVVCDRCFSLHRSEPVGEWLLWACRGYPALDGRVRFAELQGSFKHNMGYHAN